MGQLMRARVVAAGRLCEVCCARQDGNSSRGAASRLLPYATKNATQTPKKQETGHAEERASDAETGAKHTSSSSLAYMCLIAVMTACTTHTITTPR